MQQITRYPTVFFNSLSTFGPYSLDANIFVNRLNETVNITEDEIKLIVKLEDDDYKLHKLKESKLK